MIAKLCLDGWAGRREIDCAIVGETARRYRIQLLEDARLPGNREVKAGDVVLVPKQAIKIEVLYR